MALALVTLLVLHHLIWWVGLSILKAQPPPMTWESHADNRGYKVILASYCILAVAILLAFVKNLSFFEANSITGPLLQAFIRMIIDVAKFFLYFFSSFWRLLSALQTCTCSMTKPESISTQTIQEQVKAMPLIYKGAYN